MNRLLLQMKGNVDDVAGWYRLDDQFQTSHCMQLRVAASTRPSPC